jgi:hypothetical protein
MLDLLLLAPATALWGVRGGNVAASDPSYAERGRKQVKNMRRSACALRENSALR